MKREQAVRISGHLRDACAALDKADRAIAGLGKKERLLFSELLNEVSLDVQAVLLLPIYDQYPDLAPPETEREPPDEPSELTWSEVRLPRSVTEQRLDEIIFSFLKPQWQKVAKLIDDARKRCEELALPISPEVIGARLQVLSDSDRIEGIGDIRIWRRAEVRLKD